MRTLPKSRADLSYELHREVSSAAVKVMDHIKSKPSHIQVMSLVAAIWVILKDTSYTASYLMSLASAIHDGRSHLIVLPDLHKPRVDIGAEDRLEIAGGAVQVMDAVRGLPVDIQLLAYATLLWKIDIETDNSFGDLLQTIDLLSKDAVHSERVDHRFAALKFYFRRHLKDKL